MASDIVIYISAISILIAFVAFAVSYRKLMQKIKKLDIKWEFASFKPGRKVNKPYIGVKENFTIKASQVNFLIDDLESRNKNSLKIRLLREAWLVINSGLILSIITLIDSEESIGLKDDQRNKKIDTNTVIGMLVGEKIKKDTKSYLVLFMAMVLSVFLPTLDLYIFNPYVTALFVMLICFIAISHKLLEYRISNGFYGSNSYEAKEIILFIQTKLSDDDFDGFGKREVFQEKDVKAKRHKDELGGVTE